MLSKKTLGIAGAAAMSLVGSHLAHALISVNDSGDTTGAVTYAKETLSDAVISDGKTYYTVNAEGATDANGDDLLRVETLAKIELDTAENAIITYKFVNMVLAEQLTSEALKVKREGSVREGLTINKLSGGGVREDEVRFGLIKGTLKQDDVLSLLLKKVSLADGMDASIDVTTSFLFVGEKVKASTSIKGAIKTEEAFTETVTPHNVTADVGSGFLKFKPMSESGTTETEARLGGIKVSVNETFRAATSSSHVSLDDIVKTDVAGGLAFEGDVSFVEGVYLSESAENCKGLGKNLLKKEDDLKYLDTATIGDVDDKGASFCIRVDPEQGNIIPETDYTVTTSYMASGSAAFTPNGRESGLGSIDRDGTVVHIPYLTTDERYNQRLVIVNRGSKDVDYSLSFTEEDGVTATPGGNAKGVLKAKKRTVLGLNSKRSGKEDVVTLDGKSRIAASLIVVAPEGDIDVATVQFNIETGSTDTVKYH